VREVAFKWRLLGEALTFVVVHRILNKHSKRK